MVLTSLAITVAISIVGAQAAPSSTNASGPSGSGRVVSTIEAFPAVGDRGDSVVRLQRAIVARGFTLRGGIDGVFSEVTAETLRSMQRSVGLRATGKVDSRTARFLGLIGTVRLDSTMLPKSGDRGDAVWTVQQALINAGVDVKGGADGVFGVATTVALMSFQQREKLSVTKVLDHATAARLGLIPQSEVPAPVVVSRPAPVVAPVATPVATPAAVGNAPVAAAGPLTISSLPRRGERSENVRTVQNALIGNGVEVKGGADGIFGIATAIALGNFQASRGLPQTQALDYATATALGIIATNEALGLPSISVFPVQGRCSYTDSWGEARGSRRHEGVDIVAPRGNLIYAVVDGVITKKYMDASLSGNALRLTTGDGTYFFYAHLDTIAPGIDVGTPVRAGQVLGTNGSTGNTSTPHLHFEVHPRGGAAINPFPIVKAVDACHVTEPRG
ncbi:MAG: peptidoglycan-binding protein [Ilumatobacteraceae bacterium]